MALNKDIVQRWHNSQVVLIGGSAGSFKPIFRAVKNFTDSLNKSVIIVIHRKKNFFSEIEKLFAENSRMLLKEISDKDVIRNNTVYIAPANYHVLIESEKVFSLDVSDAVWYSKPSIDVTFESAADVYGSQCTAILLSGANQDGAEGLLKLKTAGALTIVQDPDEADMAEMPLSAIHLGAARYILSNDEIFELLKI
ncbi:chemotaxis protein CheB [Mucilaginibacter mali]|uniref:protein-glutamate methylesterase n=1 Tax=Mucilaginibacter mali TaxID=2740462 RepID=A0A7D4Q086_9SPHI|nr:chemotaxis protein CheB [Mucilaginibacter mali]QKJ29586.1 chemotaxis protein CheB [Mucilaginibacter mali]